MSAAEIQARLKSLFDATKAVSQLTSQLATWSPEGELTASTGSLNRSSSNLAQSTPSLARSNTNLSRSSSQLVAGPTDRVELASAIHARLADLDADFDLLQADAAPLTAPPPRRLDAVADASRLGLLTQLQRLAEDLTRARSQFRKAQLLAKRAADAAQRKEREKLFADLTIADATDESSAGKYPRHRKRDDRSGEQRLTDAASDVTLALRRTHQRMSAELHRSEFARSTLQRSNAQLRNLTQSYSGLDGFLKQSRGLVQTLRTSKKSDTWYLETALWILAVTILWLIFRRIFYGPVRYLVYLPTKWILQAFSAIAQIAIGLISSRPAAAHASGSATSINTHATASGKGATRNPDMPQPSMNAGAGGAHAKEGHASSQASSGDPSHAGSDGTETLSDQVGALAEAKQREEQAAREAAHPTQLRERRADEPVNPKKRMWEEPPPSGKDEL